MTRKFSSVPTPSGQDDAEGTDSSTVPSAPFSIFWINNDGRIEGHAEHGTFAYTDKGWVFTPVQFPTHRVPVTDWSLLRRLCLEFAGSEALGEWAVNR